MPSIESVEGLSVTGRSINEPQSIHKPYFKNLDGLRFLAAFIVICNHAFFIRKTNIYLLDQIIFLLTKGAYGVQFFFVLSGFLITYLLFDEEDRRNIINIKKFYIRRIFRIWPLYYTIVILGFVIIPPIVTRFNPAYHHILITTGATYVVFFLANYGDIIHNLKHLKDGNYILATIWSVSIEEQFYLIWPILFVLFRKARPYLFLVVIAISIFYKYYILAPNNTKMYLDSIANFHFLALGGLLAWAMYYKTKAYHFVCNMPKALTVTIYILGMGSLVWRDDIVKATGELAGLITALFFAFVIAEQSFNCNRVFNMGRAFFSKWGKYTYAMYMIHPSVILFLEWIVKSAKIWNPKSYSFNLLYFSGCLIFTILLSICSYYILERPFLILKNKYFES
ncbi:MAG: acyltransferase [Taibaiella sp.]|nr:acyltransferase [Taibaiella sp.]